MARSIWKYQITPSDEIVINMPAIADVLCVQAQGDQVCVWALVDVDSEPIPRYFRVYGTGHDVDHAKGRYIGTFQLSGGSLVFHLFEIDKMEE